jgi:CheY-like chemotaxis protein
LVEDNPVNAMVARRLLEKKGWQVSDAGDGRQAVEVWARESFDLILMDIQMPVMDGFEATEEIRRRENPDARTPIVAITAHAMTGDRERCLKGGMDNYIAKPIMPDVFFSVCEEALGRSTAAARSLRTGMER